MLELAGLTRSFGTVRALDDLTFQVEPGKLFGFLGPNGAGKTTTMRIVLGLEQPDAGEVRWKGSPIGPDERLHIGYLPEERGLYPKMRIADQVELFAQLYGMDPETAAARTITWLDRLGLADRATDAVETLSLGNQQRVQLAVALIHEPDLLLLDEPFSGLDPIAADLMRDVLQERADQGAAVVFSSHQLDVVENICEDVAIIDHGRLVLEGRVDDLRQAGSRRLEIGAVDGWKPSVPGAHLVGRDGRFGWAKVELTDDADPQRVLADAQTAGPVTHFAVELEPLSELFRTAVGHSSPSVDGGAPDA